MATEVTVKVRGNHDCQALFIQNEQWDLYLSDIRTIFDEQEIEVPTDYRFLTGNGNVVSTALERNVTFRELFGLASVGGHGLSGMMMFPQQQSAGDQEAVTALMVKLSELEVSSRFEIKDLTRKLSELEDLYLRDLDVYRTELTKVQAQQAALEDKHAVEMDKLRSLISGVDQTAHKGWPTEPELEESLVMEQGAGDTQEDLTYEQGERLDTDAPEDVSVEDVKRNQDKKVGKEEKGKDKYKDAKKKDAKKNQKDKGKKKDKNKKK